MTKETEVLAELTAATARGTIAWDRLQTAALAAFMGARFLASLPTGRTFLLTVPGLDLLAGVSLEIRDRNDKVVHTIRSDGPGPTGQALIALWEEVRRSYEETLDGTLEDIRAVSGVTE